eukprot:972586-Prymnesium_polylepis.1
MPPRSGRETSARTVCAPKKYIRTMVPATPYTLKLIRKLCSRDGDAVPDTGNSLDTQGSASAARFDLKPYWHWHAP